MFKKSKILMSLVAVAMFAAFTPKAEAATAQDHIAKLSKSLLGKVTNNDNFVKYLCQKANIFEKRVSIRSFSGIGCSVKEIAALAQFVCKDKHGYNDSGCAKNAKKVLSGVNSNIDTAAVQVLDDTAENKSAVIAKLVCNLPVPDALKNVTKGLCG